MKVNLRLIISICILIVCNLILYTHIFFKREAASQAIGVFPNRILDWCAKDVIYDPKVLSSLDPDKIIYKTYYNTKGYPPITLFIAYYKNLEKADLSHSPVVCFSGQGWEIRETTKQTIPVGTSKGSCMTVNKIYLHRLNTSMVAYYWYQSPDRAFANRGIQKLYMFWAKIRGQSDKNAFVRVTVPVPKPGAEQEMSQYLSSFVEALYPLLRKFLQ